VVLREILHGILLEIHHEIRHDQSQMNDCRLRRVLLGNHRDQIQKSYDHHLLDHLRIHLDRHPDHGLKNLNLLVVPYLN